MWTLDQYDAYTSDVRVEVGVRELRENLSLWLDRAAAGDEVVVTERGRPKARLTTAETGFERLVREGAVTLATSPRTPIREGDLTPVKGSIASLLGEQRSRSR